MVHGGNPQAGPSEAGKKKDNFLALEELSRKLVVSMLNGMDNMCLNEAVMNQ